MNSAKDEKWYPSFHISSYHILLPEDNHSWLSAVLVLLEVISTPLNNVYIDVWFSSSRHHLLSPALKDEDFSSMMV